MGPSLERESSEVEKQRVPIDSASAVSYKITYIQWSVVSLFCHLGAPANKRLDLIQQTAPQRNPAGRWMPGLQGIFQTCHLSQLCQIGGSQILPTHEGFARCFRRKKNLGWKLLVCSNSSCKFKGTITIALWYISPLMRGSILVPSPKKKEQLWANCTIFLCIYNYD